MNYIGLDVHRNTTSVSVVKNGKEIRSLEIATTDESIRAVLRAIPGPKSVAVEEGVFADWVYRLAQASVEKVVICNPKWNRLVSEAEDKDDPVDAYRLALLLWMNQLRPVQHPSREGQKFKEAVIAYWQAHTDLTRAQNRLKFQFLRRGIPVEGDGLYRVAGREAWGQRFEQAWGDPSLVESLWRQADFFRRQKAERLKMIRGLSSPFREPIRSIQSIPGVGPIVAMTLVALLADPFRFANKRRLWKYCGLSVRCKTSAGKRLGRKKRSREGNPLLKGVLGIAAQAALRSKDNDLAHYGAQLENEGLGAAGIRRSLSRKIAVLAVTLWKKKERFRNGRACRPAESVRPDDGDVKPPEAAAPLSFRP